MSKRQKFAIAALILVVGILAIRFPALAFLQWRFRIILFGLLSWALSVWAIKDRDFSGIEWGTLVVLPTLFPLAAALTFPLLPSQLETIFLWPISYDTGLILTLGLKLVFLLLFVAGYYAILLTENIYNVAGIRTIQLLRAAHSVGFIMALATSFCFYLVIASFRLNSLANFLLVTIVSWAIIFPTVWAVNLNALVGEKERVVTFFIGLILGEVAWVLSFWPLSTVVLALFLTATFYSLVGISQYYLSERLFGTTVREFLLVITAIFLLIILTTSWRG